MVTTRNTSGLDYLGAKHIQTIKSKFGKTLTITPVTKTIDNIEGDETLTEGTSTTIVAPFWRKEDEYVRDKIALFEGADALIISDTDADLEKDYKVTFDSVNYRVDSVITRGFKDASGFFKMARCFKI